MNAEGLDFPWGSHPIQGICPGGGLVQMVLLEAQDTVNQGFTRDKEKVQPKKQSLHVIVRPLSILPESP